MLGSELLHMHNYTGRKNYVKVFGYFHTHLQKLYVFNNYTAHKYINRKK